MRKRLLISCLLLAALSGGAGLCAQANELVDEFVEQKPALFGHSAYLILTAGGKIPETATIEEAATYALDQRWGLPKLKIDSPVSIDQVSLLIMRSLDMKGGLFYSLFPGPRYALRELTFLRVAAKPNWPDKPVAGDEVMRMLTKAMDIKEKQ
jgi:hypothetical protein